jgi:hypothetical protein
MGLLCVAVEVLPCESLACTAAIDPSCSMLLSRAQQPRSRSVARTVQLRCGAHMPTPYTSMGCRSVVPRVLQCPCVVPCVL